MCLLVVCEPDGTPKREDLHAGACANPHGYGFAIIAGDTIISERGMSAKKIINRFLELRALYPSGYAMWHARYATHGVKNEYNCHPFKVGESDLTYLAHNGILDVSIEKGDRRSDTRVFAEDTLPKIGGVTALDDDTIWNMVSAWSKGSKIAVLTVDPKAQHRMYLVNEKSGEWDDDGVWWSNGSHKRKTYTPPALPYVSSWTVETDRQYELELKAYNTRLEDEEEVVDVCPNCEALVDLVENPYYCIMCEMCYDCGSVTGDCLCWTPEDIRWQSKHDLSHFW